MNHSPDESSQKTPETSGVFDLDIVGLSRLAGHNYRPEDCVCLLVQMGAQLGCRRFEFSPVAESRGKLWVMKVIGARRPLDLNNLPFLFSNSLGATAQTAEAFFVTALSGLSCQASTVRFVSNGVVQSKVFGKSSLKIPRVGDLEQFKENALIVFFELANKVNFIGFGGNGPSPLVYSPLAVEVQGFRLNHNYSPRLHWLFAKRLWLEYLGGGSSSRFRLNPTGEPSLEIGAKLTIQSNSWRQVTSVLRWVDPQALPDKDRPPLGSIIILVEPGMKSQTRFHPVQSGKLLEPILFPCLPSGFEVVFDADSLPLERDYRRLILSNELRHHLQKKAQPAVVHACNLLIQNASGLAKAEASIFRRRKKMPDFEAIAGAWESIQFDRLDNPT